VCDEDEFTCDCITQNTCAKPEGCLSRIKLADEFIRCPNERLLVSSNFTRINIHRLNDISECNDIGFPQCDNSTCFHSTSSIRHNDCNCCVSQVLCTSHCDVGKLCNGVFQCADNTLIFQSQFCDGIVDCFDGSDETRNHPGFKCDKCILPQRNLYDDFAHCINDSDLCFSSDNFCFQCFDKRLLISSIQVCDGVDDCYDKSDECLCEKYFDFEKCKNMFEDLKFHCYDNNLQDPWHSLVNNLTSIHIISSDDLWHKCNSKHNSLIFATKCDGRPECRDLRDECECLNPPGFCNDSCHSYFPMGDRYCDGVEDPAWQYINKSECPRGFDELFCPERFKCNATGKVSIDVLQVCDGKPDCDDASDEDNCPESSNLQSIFSSETDMIASPLIKSAFWIMGFLVIIGNSYVIITTIAFIKTKQKINGIIFQHVIILNISFADFIMGIYLITIASYDASFSGFYGVVDREWRSSLKCSIIGSLAVISSESSCFLMVVLTAFRLKNILRAIESLTSSIRPWTFGIFVAWFLSLTLSIVPLIKQTSKYFLHSFSYSSNFQNGTWHKDKLEKFACRLAALTNTKITSTVSKFQSIEKLFIGDLPNKASIYLFGYYGETSICMPRFYVGHGESSWEYTITILTLNFLSFIFIATGYFMIYKHFIASSANVGNNRSNSQATRMQKRIAYLIATDFCCIRSALFCCSQSTV